jgi:hypothetical protein
MNERILLFSTSYQCCKPSPGKGAKINSTPNFWVCGLIYEMGVFINFHSLGCCKELLESERNQLLQVSSVARNVIINADCHLGDTHDSLSWLRRIFSEAELS